MKTIARIIVVLVLVDFLGFCMWMASGQIPQSKFYVGVLTTKVLSAILLHK